MAKQKVHGDKITVRLPTGTLARMAAVRRADETLQEQLRAPIVAETERREAITEQSKRETA